MRLLKLAVRAVLEWRRVIAPAVAAVAVVSAIVTLAGSVTAPLTETVRHRYRTQLGEFTGERDASDGALADLTSLAGEPALVATGAPIRGVIDSGFELLLVRVVRADLESELAFRDLGSLLPGPAERAFTAGDALLLGDERPPGATDGRQIRVVTDDGSLTATVLAVAGAPDEGTTLLVHDTGSASAQTRVRGLRRPLTAPARRSLPDGFEPTGWREIAERRLAPLARSVVVLVIVLASLAAAALVPGQLLLARTTSMSLRTLTAWGFAPRTRSALVVTMGGFASLAASLVGASVGLGIAAVMNARGRPALELLPLDLAQELPRVLVPVTPSVGWAAACAVAAALLGALTALPSARVAGRVELRRDLWHW